MKSAFSPWDFFHAFEIKFKLFFLSGHKAKYDQNGNLVTHPKGHEITYNNRGHVSSVQLGSKTVTYLYDDKGRLISRQVDNEIMQFFYGHIGQPHLISHVYKPQEGQLTSLIYHEGRLIFVADDSNEYYVVTDINGSPLLILTAEGQIVKEVTRTPFGLVTYDSNQDLLVPIGFHGGYYDSLVNLVHFQVRLSH